MTARTADERGAFGVLEREESLLLVANYRDFGNGRVLCWDLPGGGVEEGETLEEACIREMREETGRRVEVLDLAFMIERFGFRSENPDRVCHYFFFHVRALEELGSPRDPKIVDLGFKSPPEIARLCTQPYHGELHEWLESDRQRRYFLNVCLPGRKEP